MSYGRTQRSAGPVEGTIHGAVIYVGLSIGLFLTRTLALFMAGEDSIIIQDTDEKLFAAAQSGFEGLVVIAPLLAVGLAIYYAAADQSGPAFFPAAVGAAVGTLLAGLLMLILMIVFEPDAFDIGFGDELPVLLSLTIGSAVTAVLSGLSFELV